MTTPNPHDKATLDSYQNLLNDILEGLNSIEEQTSCDQSAVTAMQLRNRLDAFLADVGKVKYLTPEEQVKFSFSECMQETTKCHAKAHNLLQTITSKGY